MEELNRSYLENKYGRGTLQSLREIDINEIGIERIESTTFKRLTRLKVLSLVNTHLTQIDGKLFDDLLKLIELWLHNNRLIGISSDTFSGLTRLDLVNLENNVIENLEENCFRNLPNLEKLLLNRNKLKRIRENTFKGLRNLTTLWLNENEIVMIDVKSFGTLLNLEFLWLGNNKLEEIKRNCFECLSSIKVIEIYENQYRALSFKKQSTNSGFNRAKLDENGFLSDWNTFLEQFPQLEKKCLKSEKREEEKDSDEDRDKLKFPIEKEKKDKKADSFSKKGKKADVTFKSEKLHTIEELKGEYLVEKYGKDNLINLIEIDISESKIRKIDSNTFTGLTKLERLNLSYNEIEEIDERSFENLSNLKVLRLDNNKLKRIDSNTFKELTNLEKLSLSNNEIEEINFRLFEALTNLKVLYLSHNKLKIIDSDTFKGLEKLEILDLENNEIEEIDVRLFEALSNLKELYLSHNKLKEIDRKCFEPLKSVEVIKLYENVGLNVLSFKKPSISIIWYSEDKKKKYGSISEWNKFLQQFPQLEIQDIHIGLLLNDRYKVVRLLGKGTFELVYLVDDTKTDKKNKKKAMKIMDKSDSVTENELDLLIEICHENIVRYFDHFHMRIGDEYKTLIIMEYCEKGDLRMKIKEAKRLDRNFEDRQILDWISQSTNALKYLHSRKPYPIIHRDIKPENMLLNGVNEIKIIDFGVSKLMENTHASTHAGTPPYMSPEVFKALFMDTIYYPNTDVWSLGCVLFELIFLTKAFPEGQRNDPPIPTKVSSSGIFSSVLTKMLEKDCLVRITSGQLLAELENLSDSK